MSKVSSAIKEIGQFLTASGNVLKSGDEDALREALIIARTFISITILLVEQIGKNPWKFALTIAFGGRFDPYEDARPIAEEFTQKWLSPQEK